MSTQLIDRAVVAAKIGVKRRFLRENLEKKPGFPKPRKALTQKTVLWSERDIDLWIQRDERKAA